MSLIEDLDELDKSLKESGDMPEEKIKKFVRLKFTGGIYRQRFYRGDGLIFDLQSPGDLEKKIEEGKAAQILADHSGLFEVVGDLPTTVKKSVVEYQNKAMEAAPANKTPSADDPPGDHDWDKPKWVWKSSWMSRFLNENKIDHNPNSTKKVLWEAIKKYQESLKK